MFKAIIVDDEISVCTVIRNIVDWKGLGFDIVGQAHDGFAALDLIKKQEPHLIVCDIRMPGLDGVKLIQEVGKLNLASVFIFVSGYDDFEYVRQVFKEGAYEYLLKPLDKDEFRQALSKAYVMIDNKIATDMDDDERVKKYASSLSQLRMHFVNDCLLTSAFETPTVEEVKHKYGINFDGDEFRILVIQIIGSQDKEPKDYDILEKTHRMKQYFENTFKNLEHEAIYSGSGNKIIVVLNYMSSERKNIYRKLVSLSRSVLGERHYKYAWGLGRSEAELKNIKRSYDSAAEATHQRFCYGKMSAALYEGEIPGKSGLELIPIDRIMNLKVNIEAFDEVGLSKDLADAFNAHRDSGGQLFTIIDQVALHIQVTFENKNKVLQRKEFTRAELIRKAEACEDLQEVISLFAGTFQSANAYLSELKQDYNRRIIQNVKKYVIEHICDEVSLQEAAKSVYLHPAYLSELFKKEEGINFSNYVTDVKIKVVKDKLKHTNQKVGEIARSVGYKNSKYFSKVFRSSVGLTPSEFRRLNV